MTAEKPTAPEPSAEMDHAWTWALADRIMSISYGYAVAMHESIAAGRGAVGWQDFKQAAEITTVLGDALDGARDAAAVAYQRGYEKGCEEVHEAWATDGKRMEEEARAEGERAGYTRGYDDGNNAAQAEGRRREAALEAEIERGDHLRREP